MNKRDPFALERQSAYAARLAPLAAAVAAFVNTALAERGEGDAAKAAKESTWHACRDLYTAAAAAGVEGYILADGMADALKLARPEGSTGRVYCSIAGRLVKMVNAGEVALSVIAAPDFTQRKALAMLKGRERSEQDKATLRKLAILADDPQGVEDQAIHDAIDAAFRARGHKLKKTKKSGPVDTYKPAQDVAEAA